MTFYDTEKENSHWRFRSSRNHSLLSLFAAQWYGLPGTGVGNIESQSRGDPADHIPTPDRGLLVIPPTATPKTDGEVNGISVQRYVKIEGTGGLGLRIRNEPGIDSEVQFIANESEVFIVIGGPEEKDGIIWWQLSTPYDETRNGWASSDYLSAVEK